VQKQCSNSGEKWRKYTQQTNHAQKVNYSSVHSWYSISKHSRIQFKLKT